MIYDEKENALVCEALGRVGIRVTSVYDLVNSSASYPEAIPVLLEMLKVVKSDRMIEGVARALTVREARGIAAKPLIAYFRKYQASNPSQEATKWAIGNALSGIADKEVFDEVVELVRDKRHGSSRGMLPRALANMKDPRVIDILVELLDDDDPGVVGQTIYSLGKLKAKKAKPSIKKFLTHRESWVRAEAKKALAKLDKLK
jgi:HEAT repeat protein